MPETGLITTQTINAFRGENSTAPASLLPIEISPDAQDMDYIDSTLKKRKGRLRLHGIPMQSGGVLVQNDHPQWTPGNSYLEIVPAVTVFGNKWEIQLAVIPLSLDATGGLEIVHAVTTATPLGFKLTIELDSGNLVWQFSAVIGSAFVTVTGDAANKAVVGVPQWLQFGVNGDGVNSTVFLKINDIVFNSASTAGNFARDTFASLKIGRTELNPFTQVLDMLFDELRIYANTNETANPRRELLSSEEASSDLTHYWKFDSGNTQIPDEKAPGFPVNLRIGNTTGGRSPVLSQGVSSNSFSRSIIADLSLSKVLGIAAHRVAGVATQILCTTRTDFHLFESNATTFLSTHQQQDRTPDESYWYSSAFKDRTIMTSRAVAVFKYDGTNIPFEITPVQPLGTLAAAVGAAGALTGDYTYIVTHFNSADNSESEADTQLSGSGGGFVQPTAQQVDLTALPISDDPQVDKKRIYRTKAGGAIFFFLTTIDNSLTTHTDNALDTTLVTRYNDLLGAPAASRFAFVHDERVWLGNQVGQESRLLYTEVTTDLNIGGWTQFAAENFADFGRGDGDEMTGGIPVTGAALITKQNSLWMLVGLGPAAYGARKLYGGVGCVSHGTLAASRLGVYLLSASGVVRVPLPLGTAPWENLTEESHRNLFENILESDWAKAAGIFDTVRQEYRVSFISSGEELSLTYHEKTASWSKSTAHYDAYLEVPFSGGAKKLLATKHGTISEMHNGDNEGADIENSVRAWAVTGKVDAATVETLQDTSQSFPSRLDPFPFETLIGLEVTVEDSAGVQQRRTIWHNDGDTLHVTPDFSPAPTVGDDYWIGGIDARWKSVKLDLDGNRGALKGISCLRTFFRKDGNTVNVKCDYAFDEATIGDLTFVSNNRVQELTTRDQGQELEIEFSNDQPEEPFEIEALQLCFTQDD